MDRRRAAFALILLLAAVLGVQAALEWDASPYGAAPMLDEAGYIRWARTIAAGDVLGSGVFYQDPLYPYVLGLILRLSGGSLLAARLLQVGFGVAAVAMVYAAARRLFDDRAAFIAGALLALYGVHVYAQAVLLKECLAASLVAGLLLLAARAEGQAGAERRAAAEAGRSIARDLFLLGVVLGLLSLLRANVLAFVPVALAWAFFRLARRAPIWIALGVACALFPVTLRNWVVARQLVVTTSQAGPNFYIGNSAEADGTYAGMPWVRADPLYEAEDFTREAERREGRKLTPTEVSRFWWKASFAWMRDNPGRAAALMLRKAWLAVDAYEVPDNESFACMRAWFMPVLWVAFVGMGLLLGPAVAGAVLMLRERRGMFVLLFIGVYAVTLVAFFVVSRYRLPLVPPLALCAARFATAVWDAARERKGRMLAGLAVVALTTGALAHLPSPPSRNHTNYLARCALTSGTTLLSLGRPADAIPLFEKAIELQPTSATHRYNLAIAQQRAGNVGAAIARYREAVQLDPNDHDARKNLVLLLVELRRCTEAHGAATADLAAIVAKCQK